MEGGPQGSAGPKVGPGTPRAPERRPWFDPFTSLYSAILLIGVFFSLTGFLVPALRARYPLFDSACKGIGQIFTGPPAEKLLAPNTAKLIESDAQRGRGVRDTKYYQWLYQKLQAAKERGRDTSAAEKRLGEAGLAIQEGRFKLAEDIMSGLNFDWTEFGSDSQSQDQAKP
jgi:hypothetical protein